MAFLPGGTSTKLGDRYEGRCCVSLMLQVLAEQIRSIEIEAIGDDEVGVDLWTITNAGRRVARQCKAFNRSESDWSIAELARRGVLKKAAFQLRRSNDIDFSFMSSVLAADLENLSRFARDCGGDDVDRYVEQFVRTTHKAAWSEFCKAVELDANVPADRAASFSLLKRIHVEAVQDDQRLRDHSETLARLQLQSLTPATALAALAEIASENLHRPLGASELLRLLERYEILPRAMSNDPRVTTHIQQLQTQFFEEMSARLAAGTLITRPETGELKKLLENPSRTDAIVLHGPPGYGKSGVLYELAKDLTNSGYVVLVVRLDRQAPSGLTSKSFGEQLGLPDSPVFCLRDMAAGQRAVLIIDQLDAMRWTNSHSAQGLDVCKQLLREAAAIRQLESRVDVVLACRTYDLDHDLEIKTWLSPKSSLLTLSKVEVRPLASRTVIDVIQSQGIEPSRLNARQLALLESVHRLTMWLEMLLSDDELPDFTSSSALLRDYWKNRRRELAKAGCDANQAEAAIRRLAEHMESNGCLTAPESLLGRDEKLATEMQSLGMISVRSERVSFGHQSNLDFLIAEAALEQLQVNNLDIVRWCGLRDEQSLFRREQLRQLLLLMADEDHAGFIAAIRQLLAAKKIRFHFKQLGLEAMGQVAPQPASLQFVLEMLDNSVWGDPIAFQVITGNIEWIQELWRCGTLLRWLSSSVERPKSRAIHWLYSLSEKAPDFVASVCETAKTHIADWPTAYVPIVRFNAVQSPSDAFFGLYLDCLDAGMKREYVNWGEIAKTHPARLVPLFKSWQASWIKEHFGKDSPRDDSHLEVNDNAKALLNVARNHPRETWDALWPMIIKLTRKRILARNADDIDGGKKKYWSAWRLFRVPRMLRRMVIESGRQLARVEPDVIKLAAVHQLLDKSKLLRATIAQVLCRLPTSDSEYAIDWLLKDERRFHCGNDRSGRWKPAKSLIRRHSRRCSLEAFQRLEDRLLRFRDPNEKRSAEYWLQATREGRFWNQFGAAQHELLSCLAEQWRSIETIGRIGVLDRKFGQVANAKHQRHRRAGFTRLRSPIDSRLDRLSDRTWLKLVRNNKFPDNAPSPWRETSEGFTEASIARFSESLGRAAERQPRRFAQLALQMPPDIHHDYVGRLLNGLKTKKVPDSIPEAEREHWESATDNELQCVLEHFPIGADSYVGQTFCSIIGERPQILSNTLVDKLKQCVSHPHPSENWSIFSRSSDSEIESLSSLEATAINAVRPLAARAIASVIWHDLRWFEVFKTDIEQVIRDPHPAVRISALYACAAAWKEGQPHVLEWFFTGIESDSRVAASHRAREFYNSLFPEHAERLCPVIRHLSESQDDEIAKAGAAQVAARWIFFDLFGSELQTLMSGTLSQRKGLAEAVGQLLWIDDYTAKCLPLAEVLLDDPHDEVRRMVAHSFIRDESLDRADAGLMLLRLIHSKSFADADQMLTWSLNERTSTLEPFADAVIAMAHAVSSELKSPESKQRYRDLGGVLKLLKRLYETTSGPNRESVRRNCLDALDVLLEASPSLGWTLVEGLEAK